MVDNRPTGRPSIWVVPSHNTWVKRDSTTIYTTTIYDDEELTQPRDLTGERVFIIISKDDIYDELWTVEITDKVTDAPNGILSSTFPKSAVNQSGEWKVELYILDPDNVTRYYAHHVDFEVI